MIKNFKIFESGEKYKYYKIFTDGSLEKFQMALIKLGYYKEFCYDWGIENDFMYIMKNNNGTDETYNLLINNDIIYLFFRQHRIQNKKEFFIDNNYNFPNAEYCGEVHIEDYEINANKYNL